MIYFLENSEGLMLGPDGAAVDDLDFAATFSTEAEAEARRLMLTDPTWEVMEDVSE